MLSELAGLEFVEDGHIYTLNGEVIPSVSTVMAPLSSRVYGEVDKNVLNSAARRGTAVHQAIENYILYGARDIPEAFGGYLDAFVEFWADMEPKVIAAEYRVYHKYLRYAGTFDLLAEIDGETWLIDYKTSYRVEKMLTRVQLEAYKKAMATHNVKVGRKAILHLKKNGRYSFVEHKDDDFEAWEVFKAAKMIYDYTNHEEVRKW